MANPNLNRTQNAGAPEVPEHAVDPKWAQQMERATANLDRVATALLSKAPVLERPETMSDRSIWTTPEQAEMYDNMMGRDFYKLNEKGAPITDGKFYRVTHIYPEFQTSNANEFRAKFVVERYHWEKKKGEQSTRVAETSFNIFADEFVKGYKVTAPDPSELVPSDK